jgi:WD40 repeat protein
VGHTRRVEALAFSSDSTRLVSSGGDYTIKVWKLPEGTTEQR